MFNVYEEYPGLERIADLDRGMVTYCGRALHEPPPPENLVDGIYKYTCPECGNVKVFAINKPVREF